jgi:hypothetical protein
MEMDYVNMKDRELLLVLVERTNTNISSLISMENKINRIEQKILEDVEIRVRSLENKDNERNGMYKLWLFVVGLISIVSIGISIKNSI